MKSFPQPLASNRPDAEQLKHSSTPTWKPDFYREVTHYACFGEDGSAHGAEVLFFVNLLQFITYRVMHLRARFSSAILVTTFSLSKTLKTKPLYPTEMPCTPAISSHSLGRAWVHDMPTKLDQAAHIGFDIELFYEDLYYVARSLPGGPTSENQLHAAGIIRSLCDERGISIVCLQPFMHYEGLRDRQHHQRRIEEMRLWIQIAGILRTKIISIPSTCLPETEISGDIDLIVSDMREVADLAAPEGISIAYESLAWGTYVDLWEQSWDVVQKVARPNFGICLDTFNIAARAYADPTTPSRRNSNAEADMKASIQRMIHCIDVKKILYIQVVDAEYLAEPLVEGHQYYNPNQSPRMSWSRNCRLFYGEQDRGAYLPVKDILKAILEDLGFEGWVSAELFNKSLTDSDPLVPAEHAQRAADSWQKIVKDFKIQVETNQRRRSIEQLPRAQL